MENLENFLNKNATHHQHLNSPRLVPNDLSSCCCGMLAMFLLLFVGQVKRGHLQFRRLLFLHITFSLESHCGCIISTYHHLPIWHAWQAYHAFLKKVRENLGRGLSASRNKEEEALAEHRIEKSFRLLLLLLHSHADRITTMLGSG